MKIYLTHSTRVDYKEDLYTPLMQSKIAKQHHLIFPHQNSHEPFSSKSLIPTLDLVLAEVSHPSTGQGIELGWANIHEIPIIAFFKTKPASSSLRIIAKCLFDYTDPDDLVRKLTDKIE